MFFIIMISLTVIFIGLLIWGSVNEWDSDTLGLFMLVLLLIGMVGWGVIGSLAQQKQDISYTKDYYSIEVLDGIYIKVNDKTSIITDKASYVNWKAGKAELKTIKSLNAYGNCIGTDYKIAVKETP